MLMAETAQARWARGRGASTSHEKGASWLRLRMVPTPSTAAPPEGVSAETGVRGGHGVGGVVVPRASPGAPVLLSPANGWCGFHPAAVVRQLHGAGHPVQAERLAAELIGRNVLAGRWTFQVVEEFDDGYWTAFRDHERRVRDELVSAGGGTCSRRR